MKKITLIIIGVLFVSIFLSSCQSLQRVKNTTNNPEYIYVTSNGYGISQEDAVNDAKLKALEQGVGAYISGKILVVNYHLVNKKKKKKIHGVILGYKILKTEQYNKDSVKVTVKFKISPKMVDQAYWEILRDMNKPRVAVIVPEKIENSVVGNPVSQTEIIKTLLKYNFNVVDKSIVNQMKVREEAILAIKGDTNAIKRLKQELGVDILILGQGEAESGGEVMGMQTASANVQARAVWLSTGEIIYSDSVREGSPGLNTIDAGKLALKKAGDELGEIFVKKILEKWMDELANGRTITVLFNGVQNYSEAEKIKEILMNQVGAIDVLERSFQKGTYRCDVIFNGNASILAQKISRYFGDKKAKIISKEVLHLVIHLSF